MAEFPLFVAFSETGLGAKRPRGRLLQMTWNKPWNEAFCPSFIRPIILPLSSGDLESVFCLYFRATLTNPGCSMRRMSWG